MYDQIYHYSKIRHCISAVTDSVRAVAKGRDAKSEIHPYRHCDPWLLHRLCHLSGCCVEAYLSCIVRNSKLQHSFCHYRPSLCEWTWVLNIGPLEVVIHDCVMRRSLWTLSYIGMCSPRPNRFTTSDIDKQKQQRLQSPNKLDLSAEHQRTKYCTSP